MSIGESVTTQEQLDIILGGLPPEFELLVTLINGKVDWFEYDEMKSLLLVREHCVGKQQITQEVASINLT